MATQGQPDALKVDSLQPDENLWKWYERLYHSNQASIYQTQLLSLAAGEVLKDFPRKLPSALNERYWKTIEHLYKIINSELVRRGFVSGDAKVDLDDAELSDVFSQTVLGSFIEGIFAGEISKSDNGKVRQIDFEYLLRTQQLVMLFAFVDAFLADTVRVICKAKPNVLKKNSKTITWERVASASSLEQLKDEMADMFAYDLGWRQDITGRLETLRSQFGLTLDCSKVDTSRLEKLEKVRDIVVHNGGRISREFVQRTGEEHLVLGQLYQVKDNDIEQLSTFARAL